MLADRVQKSHRLLLVLVAALLFVVLGGTTTGDLTDWKIGPFTIARPEGLPYLLSIAVIYALYRFELAAERLVNAGEDDELFGLERRVATSAAKASLLVFYSVEFVRSWSEDLWVAHALANGLVVAVALALWLAPQTSRLLSIVSPGAQSVLVFIAISLLVGEPLSHQIPYLDWLGVVALPVAVVLLLAVEWTSLRHRAKKSAERFSV